MTTTIKATRATLAEAEAALKAARDVQTAAKERRIRADAELRAAEDALMHADRALSRWGSVAHHAREALEAMEALRDGGAQ